MSKSGPSPIPSRLVRAGGALTWRLRDGSAPAPGERVDPAALEVLVVHRPRYNDWSWPKGKAELNEPLPLTAVREVEEETGEPVVLGAPLTVQRYRLGSGQTKEVHYWLGAVAGEGPALRTRRPVERAPRREIDACRWESVPRARSLLTRRGDRRLLDEAVLRAEAGTLVTSTLVLLRHAKAMSRSAWDAAAAVRGGQDLPVHDEGGRPLTRLGVRQALDAVDLLSAFGVAEVVSSPWTRCASTVGPYAALADLAVDRREALTEDAVAADPNRAADVIARLVDQAHAPAVVCAHRPTLPVLMGPLIEASPHPVRTAFPGEPPWLATAEMLVSHIAHAGRPAVTRVERHVTYTKLVLPD